MHNSPFGSKIRSAFAALHFSTLLALLGTAIAFANVWLGAVIAMTAVWKHTREQADLSPKRYWILLPVAVTCVTWSLGGGLPTDDLLRHILAWKLDYNYSTQYPWSDIPTVNYWLGFDMTLGWLQTAMYASPKALLYGVPIAFYLMGAAVLCASLKKAAPEAPTWLFLSLSALGLILIAPRMLLGRPEALITLVAACAWLVDSRKRAGLWLGAMLALIPFYWLGWVYAPFVLLIARPLREKVLIGAVFVGLHLAFWQYYTGDYIGQLIWLQGTMWQPANENLPLAYAAGMAGGMAFLILLSWSLSHLPWHTLRKDPLIEQSYSVLNFGRAAFIPGISVLLLVVWLAIPNQIRYHAAIVFVLMPWLLQRLTRQATRVKFAPPALLLLCALAFSGLYQVPVSPSAPKFALESGAKVWSQSPFATVFFAKGPLQVEPSFAFGSTLKAWRGIENELMAQNCDLLQKAGFTYLIERTLPKRVDCLELKEIDGEWRLWQLRAP